MSAEIIDELTKLMHKAGSQAEKEAVPEFELDDDGEEYTSVGLNGVLAATEKLVAVNRGIVEPDERDSLRYQKVLRTHSFIRESAHMDVGKTARSIAYNAARRKNLGGLNQGAFDSYISRILVGNPLTSPLEEINPMQLVENSRRVTKMGPGGLGSSRSITEEAQAVNPSQFGFISCIEGPECIVDTQVLTTAGWIKIANVNERHKVACYVNGALEFHTPERVIHEHYKGTIYRVNNKFVSFDVTPNHRIPIFLHNDAFAVEYAHKLFGTDTLLIAQPYLFDQFTPTGTKLEPASFLPIYAYEWEKYEYDGMVHCLTVPGGLFFCTDKVITDDCDPCFMYLTGNSERAGIDVRVAHGVKIGSNGRLYQKMRDYRSKKLRWMSPKDLDGLVTKIPD